MREKLYDNCEHKILNATRKSTDTDRIYEGLAACIILQALKDYKGRKIGSKGYDLGRNRADAMRFFQSDYFDLLRQTEITGEMWMAIVDTHGLPQISTEMILGTGRKKDWCYGEEGEESAGAL